MYMCDSEIRDGQLRNPRRRLVRQLADVEAFMDTIEMPGDP
jgi:hypothetical protein